MPELLTPGRLLFEEIVPEQFRADLKRDQPVDLTAVTGILQRIAEETPENYRDISHKILKLGGKASTETSSSFSIEDLRSPIDKATILKQVEVQENLIRNRKDLNDDQKEKELIKLYSKLSGEFPEKVYAAAMSRGSNLARMVASGARGNKGQLNSNVGADWLMIDSNGDPVPVPIKNSYAEGLSPAEYFASSYGTRRGLISTKFAVQDSGYLAKQLAAAAHDLVVTAKDCETARGIPTSADDKDNIGAVLAKPVAGYGQGTVITSRVLKDLQSQKVGNFLVRSPITCSAKGGLCSMCAGVRERNHLPKSMDNIGLAASSSLSEPLSQGMLSEKHSGGVASSSGRGATGFKAIDSLVQVPEVFPGGATIAQLDGRVSKVEPAPQGGSFVYVNDEKHYIPGDAELLVKPGQEIEAGDTLSSGIPNPADIVKHKGIGQGRMYFVQAMQRAFKDNKLTVNRRNLEVISRALINHVRVTDPEGFNGAIPDDVMEYNSIEEGYEPAKFQKMQPSKALGSYLQRPALHFSVGTRITPSVAKTLEDNNELEIDVDDNTPGFEPEMQRVMDIPAFKQDWMAQFHGSYLKKRLEKNVHSGNAVSHLHGTSYVPGLAKATEFGRPPKGQIGY